MGLTSSSLISKLISSLKVLFAKISGEDKLIEPLLSSKASKKDSI